MFTIRSRLTSKTQINYQVEQFIDDKSVSCSHKWGTCGNSWVIIPVPILFNKKRSGIQVASKGILCFSVPHNHVTPINWRHGDRHYREMLR